VRVIGGVLGLGWSQLNVNAQSGSPFPGPDDYAGFPLMHFMDVWNCVPITLCYLNPLQLSMDDTAAVSRLYPVTAQNQSSFPGKQIFSTTTARIHGSAYFSDAHGNRTQPMQGVNVVARWIDPNTHQPSRKYALSSVSGFSFRGNGGNPITGFDDWIGDPLVLFVWPKPPAVSGVSGSSMPVAHPIARPIWVPGATELDRSDEELDACHERGQSCLRHGIDNRTVNSPVNWRAIVRGPSGTGFGLGFRHYPELHEAAELRSADGRVGRPYVVLVTPHAYFPTHRSTQSFTVLYQSWEFCGFRTQWPSSGKYSIFDGMPSICSVVKSWKPSLTSKR